MEVTAVFKYSKDQGATWSSTKSLTCDVRPFIRYEPDDTVSSENVNHLLYVNGVARVVLFVKIDVKTFNAVDNANADADYVFVNDMRCAPLIHCYIASPATIYGYSYWASNPNTNYLVPDDIPDVEFMDQNPDRLKDIQFYLIMQTPRTLA